MKSYNGKTSRENLGKMTVSDRDEAIRRAEFERAKITSEIESILSSYAKESGNRALKIKKRKQKKTLDEWTF